MQSCERGRNWEGKHKTKKAPRHRPNTRSPPGAGAALTPELKSALDDFLSSNRIVLFMKGTREFPQCGFSNTAVGILNALGAPYETVNILEDDKLRTGMKEYSAWPTFPQLYVGGEFVVSGGVEGGRGGGGRKDIIFPTPSRFCPSFPPPPPLQGGCDIMIQTYQDGSLVETIESALAG